MRIAILYISRRGTTEKVARLIAEALPEHEVRLINLDEEPEPDLQPWDGLIIGGPIYIGELPEKLRAWLMRHLDILRSKRLGLFICGMIPDPAQQEQELRRAFPTALQEKAKAMAFLGGAFVQEKLNLFEKMIVLFLSKTRKSQEKIEVERIGPFLDAFLKN